MHIQYEINFNNVNKLYRNERGRNIDRNDLGLTLENNICNVAEYGTDIFIYNRICKAPIPFRYLQKWSFVCLALYRAMEKL